MRVGGGVAGEEGLGGWRGSESDGASERFYSYDYGIIIIII